MACSLCIHTAFDPFMSRLPRTPFSVCKPPSLQGKSFELILSDNDPALIGQVARLFCETWNCNNIRTSLSKIFDSAEAKGDIRTAIHLFSKRRHPIRETARSSSYDQ
eukprot:TRINITY_DN3179_c0_g1_i2.p1 TRINITY_DN3179_c0_g1~~TRINITY_DN3179_c0_g1_i2.p1  ORF type:complete len:107 (-),score=3.65 TRINITY_DN3179_c0_g1_i2:361-681(-)